VAGVEPAGGRFDWSSWSPQQRATLVFVRRGEELLLIHKKRGLGAGKINGPGGRLHSGESPLECAVRETQEELCVTPTGLRDAGELAFQFQDGFGIHIHVFEAEGCEGEPQETEEAKPLWVRVDRIPYERMWADDRLWLPILLAGERFRGWALFSGDELLDHDIRRIA
jgi:8-oxo-dGTP diphosphatase